MNYRAIIYYVGMVLKLEAAFMCAPLAVSIYNAEHQASRAFLLTIVLSLIVGLTIDAVKRDKRGVYVKDGFIMVAICWVCISVFGAVPFYLSGAIPSFVDCLFESISGFSTTGSTIVPVVERLPRSLLLWRSLSQWIGGMGVLVFLLAIAPKTGGEHSVHVLKAESPGPAPGKLVPRLRQSAKILYTIYLALTVAQIPLLLFGGMPLFDSVCTALVTAATGGFSVSNASIAAYDSAYLQTVINVFMVLCGINFNIFYFLLIRNFRGIWRSDELRVYLGTLVGATLLVAWNLTGPVYADFGESLHHASFQVSAAMTTTGFATTNYALWPEFSRVLLLLLMFVGASGGSTAGGLKVSRVIILVKETKRLLFRMAHPRAVAIVKLDGKAVEKQAVHAVNAYFITFSLILAGSLLLVALDNFDLETTVTSVISSISNVGPGFGMVSTVGNYSQFSVLSKIVLSVNMLIGRLEIYPILLLFSPRTWRRV